MEIEQKDMYELIRGQARIEQMVSDLKGTVLGADGRPGALFILNAKLEGTNDRIGKVEKKVIYFSGIGTAIGTGIGALGAWLGFLKH